MQLIAEGKSNQETAGIARHYRLPHGQNHRANILRKLKLTSIADLGGYAIRIKMIEA